jgi:sensor histidine kinase regulating citrate/malate metabolism
MRIEKNELFKLSRENQEWFKENYNALKRKYDQKWIVIQNEKVIRSSSIFDDIVKALRNGEYDPKTAIVEYIQSEQIAMFF